MTIGQVIMTNIKIKFGSNDLIFNGKAALFNSNLFKINTQNNYNLMTYGKM